MVRIAILLFITLAAASIDPNRLVDEGNPSEGIILDDPNLVEKRVEKRGDEINGWGPAWMKDREGIAGVLNDPNLVEKRVKKRSERKKRFEN